MTTETMTLTIGTRSWAMAKHDAGEKVEGQFSNYNDDLVWGPADPHIHDALAWRIHVIPLQPVVLQPGTPEHRKYLAADALYGNLKVVLEGLFKACEEGGLTRPEFDSDPDVIDARAALAAYRDEGGES